MATERLDIEIRERGAARASREIDGIARSARRLTNDLESTARTFRLLQNAVFVLGGAGGLRELARLSDVTGDLQNRLTLLTETTEEAAFIQQKLFDITKRTRGEFETTSQVYTRTALAAKDLGVSQQELLNFTESINKGIVLSGASFREANAALIQLSQGIASGTLRGDELRSVLEQLPFVADVIAKELGVTRGELRLLGEEGKISAEAVLRAFRNAREEIDDKFSRTVSTIAQSFSVLRTSAIEIVANFNDATSASVTFAQGIIILAENLDVLAAGVAAVGVVLAARFGQRLLANIGQAVASELQYQSAVASGRPTVLGSAQAEAQRAVAIQATTQAELASVAAQQARLQATTTQLAKTVQLAQVQRNNALVQLRATQAQIGSTTAATGAQQKLNDSTRALIASQRALRAAQTDLNAVNQQVAASTNAVAAAQGRAAAATTAAAAASTALGRLGAAAGVAGAALGRLVALLGGPLGVALLALGAVLLLTTTRTQRLREVQEDAQEQINELRLAYESADGSVNKFNESLEGLSRTQTINSIADASEVLEEQFEVLERRVGRLNRALSSGFGPDARTSINGLVNDLRDGTISVDKFKNSLDAIGDANPDQRRLIEQLQEAASSASSAQRTIELLEARLAVLEERATDAQIELLGLTDSMDSATSSADRLANASSRASEGIRTLVGFIPELANAARQQEKLQEAQNARVAAIVALRDQVNAGDISLANFETGLERINDLFNRAVTEIDGTAEASRRQEVDLQKATDALNDYSSDTILQNLDARNAALEEERISFENLRDSLVQAGAEQDALNKLQEDFNTRVSTINAEFDAQQAEDVRKALESATNSFKDYTNDAFLGSLEARDAALERERQRFESISESLKKAGAQQEELTALQEAYQQRVSQINSEFDSRASSAGGGSSGLNEELEFQKRILEQIQSPIRDYFQALSALNDLLRQGKISQDEFNNSLAQFAVDFLIAQNTMNSGLQAGFLQIFQDTQNVAEKTADIVRSLYSSVRDEIAELVVTGKADFDGLVDSITKRVAALVIDQGFQLFAQTVLGGVGGGAGGAAGAGGSIFGALGLPGFYNGGDFTVGPSTSVSELSGQRDNRLVAFRAQDGERVSVTPRNGSGGEQQVIVQFNISTPDADSFRRSENQILAKASRQLGRAQMRNN